MSRKLLNSLLIFFAMMINSPCQGDDERQPTGPIECREGYIAMKNFAQNYGKTHNLKLIDVGRLFELYPETLFGLWMADFSPQTLETGRELAMNFLNAFWAEVQKNPKTIAYFEYYCKSDSKRYSAPMTLTHMTFKIAFWDKEVNRPKNPYLAEISFHDNRFYYYQTDPQTEALQLVFEETYEEAVAKLQLRNQK